jgi:hypothetical protein
LSQAAVAPKHLWIIGIIALLWNLFGAFDYLMTQTKTEFYMSQFDQAQLDYFYGFPIWFEFFWALAVWGGVLGTVLLLMRKRLAVPVFLVSFVSMVVSAIYSLGFSNGMEIMGTTGVISTVVIFFVALGLWLYARAMGARGVLA